MRGDRRLVVVVNGLQSKKERAREPIRLLEWGFREFGNYPLLSAGEVIQEASVWLGTEPTVSLIIENNLNLTLQKKARSKMKVTVNYSSPIPAPIKKGDTLAELLVTAPGTQTIVVPLLAAADVARLGLVGRVLAAFKHILWGSSG
jgi:D-alanyl-D-alanine carboxypeptidase (penicillin-binding protein 5/6)